MSCFLVDGIAYGVAADLSNNILVAYFFCIAKFYGQPILQVREFLYDAVRYNTENIRMCNDFSFYFELSRFYSRCQTYAKKSLQEFQLIILSP